MDRTRTERWERGRPDRAVSVAVTHVLTIAITTLLISALMMSAGTMLDTERERGGENSLETIGERLAKEIAAVNRTDDASMHVDHPRRVSGATYTIELLASSDCDGPLVSDLDTACLYLHAHGEDIDVYVPLGLEDGRIEADASATGGPILITFDGSEITIRSEHR